MNMIFNSLSKNTFDGKYLISVTMMLGSPHTPELAFTNHLSELVYFLDILLGKFLA
jgi:hypothetical protein